MANLKKETISKRGNLMELQVHAAISEYVEFCTSLTSFMHNFETKLKQIKRTSTATADSQYKCVIFGDLVEVWHNVSKPRLIALVSYNR